MKNLILCMSLISFQVAAEKIEVLPDDCGPLAQCGEVGVTFRVQPHGSGKVYFTKGKATEVCPKLVESSSLVGYEVDYNDMYSENPSDRCNTRKIFIITDFKKEPNT